MQRTMVEEFTSTPEGMAEFQRERVILDVAILMRRLLKENGLTKADLAARLGKSKAFVTQLLNGRANMTLRTISDVMCALGHSLLVAEGPLEVRAKSPEPVSVTVTYAPYGLLSGYMFNQTTGGVTATGTTFVWPQESTSASHNLRIAG